MRSVDLGQALCLARDIAAELRTAAADSAIELSCADRLALITIAAAVDRRVTLWAGIEPRSPEAQAVIDAALAAVLP